MLSVLLLLLLVAGCTEGGEGTLPRSPRRQRLQSLYDTLVPCEPTGTCLTTPGHRCVVLWRKTELGSIEETCVLVD